MESFSLMWVTKYTLVSWLTMLKLATSTPAAALPQRSMLENGLGMTPPMGWNSWNHYGCNITEDIIRRTVDATVSTGLSALGYNYINIDDCWAEKKRYKGSLLARRSTFPSGIKALSEYVHSRGLKLGIYSDAGTRTCKGQPGSLFFEEQDAFTFATWGIDYLKYDNCHSKKLPIQPRYKRMSNALAKTGHPIFFSICEWGQENPATWAPKLGNSWRTTQDIKDKWTSIRTRADKNNLWASFAGPGGWNDPDMLEVGNGRLSKEEYRAHFSVWALMKAPLLIGCDVTNMDDDTLEILSNKEVIAVNQDPLGLQGKKIARFGAAKKLEVWAGPLSGNRMVVLLWNRRKVRDTIKAWWKDLGLYTNIAYKARDLWEFKDLPGKWIGSFEASVDAHAVRMYIFTEA